MAGNRVDVSRLPQFAVAVLHDEVQDADFAYLTVTTDFTEHHFYLCNAETYRQVAQGLHDNIIKAGRDMKPVSKLEVVKGVPDGIRPS